MWVIGSESTLSNLERPAEQPLGLDVLSLRETLLAEGKKPRRCGPRSAPCEEDARDQDRQANTDQDRQANTEGQDEIIGRWDG